MNIRQPNRRRGRGNNNRAPQQNRGGGDYQNRIDNRARGNAAQMLEKYKKLANDAQLNGDRVQAEYYHQFADHYFRVLADAKARQDEQQAARQSRWQERRPSDEGEYGQEGSQESRREQTGRDAMDGGSYDPYANAQRAQPSDGGDYTDMQSDGNADADYGSDEGERDTPRRQPRGDRNDRNANRNAGRDRAPRDKQQGERQQGERRPARDDRIEDRGETRGEYQGDRTMFDDAPEEARAPRETKRPVRRPRAEQARVELTDDAPATLDLAALPPAIGGGDEEPVTKPRAPRRPRKTVDAVEAAE